MLSHVSQSAVGEYLPSASVFPKKSSVMIGGKTIHIHMSKKIIEGEACLLFLLNYWISMALYNKVWLFSKSAVFV